MEGTDSNSSNDIDEKTFTKLSETKGIPKFNQICRVCLCETSESDQKLDTRILLLNNSQEIRSMLVEATGVEIVDLDFLPTHICSKCLKTLRAWFRFRSQFHLSNEILKKYLKKLSTSLDNKSLHNPDLTIHIRDEKLNEVKKSENFPKNKDNQVSVVEKKPEVMEFEFECNTCAMTFTNQVDLDKHQEEHISPPKQKSFKCEICPKSFGFLNGLHNHIELCHQNWNRYKFQCEVCQKPYNTPTGFKMHKSRPCVPVALIEQCKTQQLDVRKKELIEAAEKTIQNTKISCILCKKNFKRYESFNKHFSKHDEDRKCHICRKYFPSLKLLERHVRVHLRAKVYACSICTRSFYSFEPFRAHVHEHGKREWIYRCNMCKKEFFIVREFDRHMTKHLEAIEEEKKAVEKAKHNDGVDAVEIEKANDMEIYESNSAPEDGSKFESNNQMETDIPNSQNAFQLVKLEEDFEEDAPNEIEKDTSIQAGMDFSNIPVEDDLKSFSTDKVKIDIPDCEDSFQLVKVEEDSESESEKGIDFSIDIDDCKAQIQLIKTESQVQSTSQLESDIPTDHKAFNQPNQLESLDNNQFETNSTEIKTEIFDIVEFENPPLDNYTSEEENPDGTDDEISTLSKPNEVISKDKSAYTQEILDRCKVNCHVAGCQMKCSNLTKIWQHFKKEHLSAKKPYKCCMCFEKFDHQRPFQIHIKKYYSFQCPICLKIKTNSCELKRHVMLTHSKDRPFKCSKCAKTFTSQNYLKGHEITHNNTKEFVCSICSKDFFSYSGLNLHKKTHKDIKELQCSVCGKQFSNKYGLNRHNDTNCVRNQKK